MRWCYNCEVFKLFREFFSYLPLQVGVVEQGGPPLFGVFTLFAASFPLETVYLFKVGTAPREGAAVVHSPHDGYVVFVCIAHKEGEVYAPGIYNVQVYNIGFYSL